MVASEPSLAKAWITAFRLRTLPLAFSCILMGGFLAAERGAFSVAILLLTLLTTLFLQILSNLANDYGDAKSGVDGQQRTGPARMVSSGRISQIQMKRALILFSLLSLLSGLLLLYVAFPEKWATALVFLVIGLGAIAAAIKYTVGSKPYGYSGWGDFFVLVFFGLVGVGSSCYLHTQTLDAWMVLPALSTGLLAVGVLNLNNIRDIESDRQAGKRSIPVRIGRRKAVWYHWSLLGIALGLALIYVLRGAVVWQNFLFLISLPLLFRNARAVAVHTAAADLDPYLRQLAITTLLFVILYGFGLEY